MWWLWIIFALVLGLLLVWASWTLREDHRAVQKHKKWLVFKKEHLRQCPWCLDGCGLDYKQEEWEDFFLHYAYWCERTQSIWLGY